MEILSANFVIYNKSFTWLKSNNCKKLNKLSDIHAYSICDLFDHLRIFENFPEIIKIMAYDIEISFDMATTISTDFIRFLVFFCMSMLYIFSDKITNTIIMKILPHIKQYNDNDSSYPEKKFYNKK